MTDIINSLQNESTLVGILLTALGGVFIKWLDKTLREKSSDYNESNLLRKDMREEIKSLQEENSKLETSSNLWREKYWAEVENHNKTKNLLDTLQLKFLGSVENLVSGSMSL